MTSRILVVDYGFDNFKWMLVDIDGDFKEISKYHCIERDIHDSILARMIEEIFDENECDKIYMDIMGTSMWSYDCMSERLKNVTYGYKMDAQSNHNRIVGLLGDLQKHNIFIQKDSVELYDVIKELGRESSLYHSEIGCIKLGKLISRDVREKLHTMLGMYDCGCYLAKKCALIES